MDVAKTISDKASSLMLSVFIKRGKLSQIELEKIRAWLSSNFGYVIKNWRSGPIILNLFKYGKSINNCEQLKINILNKGSSEVRLNFLDAITSFELLDRTSKQNVAIIFGQLIQGGCSDDELAKIQSWMLLNLDIFLDSTLAFNLLSKFLFNATSKK